MILAGIIFGNDRREKILNRLLFKKGGIEKDLIEINGDGKTISSIP